MSAGVGRLLEHGVVDRGGDQPDAQPEPAVDAAHPLGVTRGEILVHRHHVHAPPVEPVQVGGQGRDEGLALTGLHLGDPAEVQRHAAHELDVEVALPEDPPGRLAHHGVGLDQQVVEGLALVEALAELDRLVGQRLVAEALHVGLEGADERHQLGQATDLLALTGLENFREHAHERPILPAPGATEPTGTDLGCVRLTWSLTPHSPAARVARRHRRHGVATAPSGAALARVASSPPAPDCRGPGGQGLPLSRTMLSDHKSPYVGRFACDWHRLSTTDPHAAQGNATGWPPRPPAGPARRSRTDAAPHCPGTDEPAEPEALPALPGVAPSSTVTSAIFHTPSTCCRLAMRRTTSAWGVLILLFT